MNFLAIAALSAGLLNPVSAPEVANNVTAESGLTKEEITAILDFKTKMHINIEPVQIQKLSVPSDIRLIARQDTRRSIVAVKNVGDE